MVSSWHDDVGGITDAGSVMLVNGATGIQIGTTIHGDDPNDYWGGDASGKTGITALSNGNYVINSYLDDVGGISNLGTATLMNGACGTQIGITIAGDVASDQLGRSGVTALTHGGYVIVSPFDDENSVVNASSARLVDARGVEVSKIVGDSRDDNIGFGGIAALANGNFVIASWRDDVDGVEDAGSVRLVDGITGTPIGSVIAGDNDFDGFGRSGVAILANGNYVISAFLDDDGGTTANAGSVWLIDGSSGMQIGLTMRGGDDGDRFGNSIAGLPNSNFLIITLGDDVAGVTNAGSIILVDGSTGNQIGTTLSGDDVGDFLGLGSNVVMSDSSVLISSWSDDVGGLVDVGSLIWIDGETGSQVINSIAGTVGSEIKFSSVTASNDASHFVLAIARDDNNGLQESGLVRLFAR